MLSDQLCLSKFSSLLLSYLRLLLSHPLYLSYFIFFSPYLLKLLSFLSPLFITTSLLLFFTPHSNLHFIFLSYHSSYSTTHQTPIEQFDELHDVFKVVFGAPSSEFYHNSLSPPHDDDDDESTILEERVVGVITQEDKFKPTTIQEEEDMMKLEEESFSKKKAADTRETEKVSDANYSMECPPPPASKVKAISQRFEAKLGNVGGEFSPSSRTLSNLPSSGSMRREKEWKRTLACKLFEERHNKAAEDMDLLWEETYNEESRKYSNGCSKKMSDNNTCRPNVKEEDLEEEEDGGGDLCCLQALKFSGGKMNLGMKKLSLVKISKAIKGIGWLHHVTTTSRNSQGKGKKGRR